MSSADRSRPPSQVKRLLRKEAHFGCCFCGSSIGQYHHIIPYAERSHNEPEHMMFVCLICHDKITKSMISTEKQYEAKNHPFNSNKKICSGTLLNNHKYVSLDVGAGVFLVGNSVCVRIDDFEIMRFSRNEGGTLDVNMELQDEAGSILSVVSENEWISNAHDVWDVSVDWHKLVIRQKERQINLEINTKKKPMTLRGAFWFSGRYFHFRDSACEARSNDTSTLKVNGLENVALVGFDLGIDSKNLYLAPCTSGGGYIVSYPNPRERLYRATSMLKRLNGERPTNQQE